MKVTIDITQLVPDGKALRGSLPLPRKRSLRVCTRSGGSTVQIVHLSAAGAVDSFDTMTPTVANRLGRLLMTSAYFAQFGVLPPWASVGGEEVRES